jgi:hypothetical protein
MSTPYPSAGPYHSFTYLHAPEGGTPDWYYLTKSTDTVWLYLIRAYVSFTGGPPVELVPPPFALEQNYPNPFNPGTWIRYSLPERAFVTLKVYNVLGQELETLVSGTQDPGKKEVFWRPSNLPSGAYVYRLQTGSAVASRKLLFIK